MRMNSNMQKLYGKLDSSKISAINLNHNLHKLLIPKFVKVHDTILLKTQKKLTKVSIDAFPDLTGYECFVNHVHIEDYIESVCSQKELFKQGLSFATMLANELKLSFPNKPFWVILSVNKSSCNVRFHQLRKDERWLADNIEEYTKEAIMVLETEGQ